MSIRPHLPIRHANPHIQSTLNAGNIPPVKYQILNCQGTDILVGRLKIETPTPTGHAFILRRFDTGAVSLTTMFRAAFPNAPDEDEKKEVQWVKENYDLSGNNGSSKEPHLTRLAGTWVSPAVALEIGNYYALGALINAVVDAKPDPNGNYRRSGKSAAATANQNAVNGTSSTSSTGTNNPLQPATRSLPTPSPTHAGPGPAKRRKESSPAPAPAPTPARAASPSKRAASPSKLPTRRSTRTKSPMPVPRSAAMPTLTTIMSKTPSPVKAAKTSPSKAKKEEAPTPASSDKTAVEDDGEGEGESMVEDGVAGEELHKQDVEEQKQLIESLKAKRDAARKVMAEEQIQDQGMIDTAGVVVTEDGGKKRTREDEDQPLQFEFKEPEVGERDIVRNSRVGRFEMEPRTKSVAWGVAAFAVAMGAVSFLPNFL